MKNFYHSFGVARVLNLCHFHATAALDTESFSFLKKHFSEAFLNIFLRLQQITRIQLFR